MVALSSQSRRNLSLAFSRFIGVELHDESPLSHSVDPLVWMLGSEGSIAHQFALKSGFSLGL